MSTIDLNFTGVQRPVFTVVPEEDYELQLSGMQVKPGKTNPDNTVAHLVYEVVNQGEYDGKKILAYQTVAGPGADPEYIKLWLEALIGEELDGDFTLDPDELLGKTCVAHVSIVPDFRDNTKEINAISYYIPQF